MISDNGQLKQINDLIFRDWLRRYDRPDVFSATGIC